MYAEIRHRRPPPPLHRERVAHNFYYLTAQLNQWNFINILFYASSRRLCSNS